MTITTQKENPNALLITKFQAEVEKFRRNEIIQKWKENRQRKEWCKNEELRNVQHDIWKYIIRGNTGLKNWMLKVKGTETHIDLVENVNCPGFTTKWDGYPDGVTFNKFYDLYLKWKWKNKPVENDFSKSRLITEEERGNNATFKRMSDKNGFHYSPISQRAVTLMETIDEIKNFKKAEHPNTIFLEPDPHQEFMESIDKAWGWYKVDNETFSDRVGVDHYIYITENEILLLNSMGHKAKILVVDEDYMIIPNPFDKKN